MELLVFLSSLYLFFKNIFIELKTVWILLGFAILALLCFYFLYRLFKNHKLNSSENDSVAEDGNYELEPVVDLQSFAKSKPALILKQNGSKTKPKLRKKPLQKLDSKEPFDYYVNLQQIDLRLKELDQRKK